VSKWYWEGGGGGGSKYEREAAIVDFLLTSPMYFCEGDYHLPRVFSTFQNGGQEKTLDELTLSLIGLVIQER